MRNLRMIIIPKPFDETLPKPEPDHEWSYSIYQMLECQRLLHLVELLRYPILEVSRIYGPYYNRETAKVMMDREYRKSGNDSMLLIANLITLPEWQELLPWCPV